MTQEYLREDRKHRAAGRSSRLGGLFTGLATLLLAACSSSSGDGGPTVPPPPPPPPPPPTNTAPTAAAGADMTVSTTIAVQLDGSGSADADGDALTFAWSLAFVPSGSSATFDDDTSAQPSFTPDVAGDYTIELVVSDGTTTSSTDEVVVTAGDNTSMQTIGAAGGQIVSPDGAVTLDIPAGALMSDADISITLVPADQRPSYLGSEFDGLQDVVSVYRLGPDGQMFTTPVTATLTTGANPSTAADTMSGTLQFLLSSEGGEAVVLEDLTIDADADAASISLSGTLAHFSPLIFYSPDNNKGLNWDIVGVPDRIRPQQATTVQAEVESRNLPLAHAEFQDVSSDAAFDLLDPSSGIRSMTRQGNSETYAADVDYFCSEAGAGTTGTFRALISTRFDVPVSEFPDPVLGNIVSGVSILVGAKKDVECESDDPGISIRFNPGVYAAALGLTDPESVQAGLLLGQMSIGGAASGATDPLLLIAGAEGSVLFNPITGEILWDSINPGRTQPLLGAIVASSTLPGGGVAGMIYEHGRGDLTANRRCDYNDVDEAIAIFCLGRNGTGYDASQPIDETAETPEVLFVTRFDVDWMVLNPETGIYEFEDKYPTDPNDFFGLPFSAASRGSSGPALVVTNNAPDFSTLSQVDSSSLVTLHETFFGEDLRKIECVDTLCGMTVFDDGTGNGRLRLATWDGVNAPALINSTIPVGDGPVGVATLNLGNGNALFGTTGFNDGTITLTQTTLSGDLVSNYTAPAPGGCQNPAHLDFYVPDGAAPSQAQLVGTCFGSNQYFVVNIQEDPALGFVFVDPTTAR